MVKPEVYRRVFGSLEGREVMADLARQVQRMNLAEPGSAAKLFGYITEKVTTLDAPVPKPRLQRAAGGRIQHG